ncbi:MAG: hypothetical protein ACE5PV_03065 [Candidatus Poribacteria bacterium]
MKRKRVEYQKYIRTKLEQKRYRELFGLTDNITLEGEEDLVLQREFRIDFILQKVEPTMPITGIFSHFKHYNILEFKSYNDPLTVILLTKYIGQLFWWLYAKRQEAKKSESVDIRADEVTLNIVTVGRPRNVINELDELLGDKFIRHGDGHYQCNVMGVELHIFVINEFPIESEYYAWLVFSEGKQYEKFEEKLAQEIKEDEKYQIYLELITELEKEGSEKMAYEILRKILREMPLEQQQKAVSPDIMKSILSGMPVEQKQEVISSDILKSILSDMPVEQKQETIRDVLSQMSKEERQKIIEQL